TTGAFRADGMVWAVAEDPLLLALLRAAVACNDAALRQHDDGPTVVGDPTEGALLVVAAKGAILRQDIEADMPRLGTLPFDSERKCMTVIRNWSGRSWAFTKGAPEVILARCTAMRTSHGVEALTENDRARMLRASAHMANEALRVLALAERPLDQFP